MGPWNHQKTFRHGEPAFLGHAAPIQTSYDWLCSLYISKWRGISNGQISQRAFLSLRYRQGFSEKRVRYHNLVTLYTIARPHPRVGSGGIGSNNSQIVFYLTFFCDQVFGILWGLLAVCWYLVGKVAEDDQAKMGIRHEKGEDWGLSIFWLHDFERELWLSVIIQFGVKFCLKYWLQHYFKYFYGFSFEMWVSTAQWAVKSIVTMINEIGSYMGFSRVHALTQILTIGILKSATQPIIHFHIFIIPIH